MALLWLTMITQFPSVLIGFAWFKEGFTITQVVIGTILSCILLLAYTVPAAFLGAVSGQTYAVLSRTVFGSWGSRIVSANMAWLFVGWYTVLALCLADELAGLIPVKVPLSITAAGLALIMAANNFFGFTGVANFARFVAGPVLLVWVGVSFVKALLGNPGDLLSVHPVQSNWYALTSISSFVVGFSVWGNEPDYWRYAKPKLAHSLFPLVASFAVGCVLFPVSGWLFAHASGITESAAATAYLTRYSMAGCTALAVLIISAAYVGANDSNLYGSVNALENLWKMPQKLTVFILALISTVLAYWLAGSGATAALEGMCSLNCIVLPMPTVVMLCEWFWLCKILKQEPFFIRIPDFSSLPCLRWPAFWANIAGLFVGAASMGIIPAVSFLKGGIPSVQSWLVAALVFFALRWLERPAPTVDAGGEAPETAELSSLELESRQTAEKF
jgi:purine-cytosine permease-like protein